MAGGAGPAPPRAGLWRRIGRRPGRALLASVLVAVAVSAVGMIVGEFEISNDNSGWESRRTLIADRQAQFRAFRRKYDIDYEEDEDRRRRRLQAAGGCSLPAAGGGSACDCGLNDGECQGRGGAWALECHCGGQEGGQEGGQHHEETDEPRHHHDEDIGSTANLAFIWEVKQKGDTVFSAENLKQICELENRVASLPGYAERCARRDYPEWPFNDCPAAAPFYGEGFGPSGCRICPMPVGMVSFLIEASVERIGNNTAPAQVQGLLRSRIDCSGLESLISDEVLQIVARCADVYVKGGQEALGKDEGCRDAGFHPSFVGKELSATNLKSSVTRTLFRFDWGEDTEEKWMAWFRDGSLDVESGGIRSYYGDSDERMIGRHIDSVLGTDAIFSALAAVIVFAFIGVITRSPFLTCMAVLQIALSFPSAFFFYKLVIGIEYFPFLNFLGLFVICGIGADDIFVLYEKWDQHVQADPDADTEDIASKALPDAAYAMALTTVTTAGAFFATAIAPVAPIQCFSIFMGCLVLFDYLWNIFIFGSAMALRHQWIMRARKEGGGTSVGRCCLGTAAACSHGGDGGFTDRFNIARFFSGPFHGGLKRTKYLQVLIFLGVVGVSTFYTTQLESPASSQIQLLKSSHPLQKFQDKARGQFLDSDDNNSNWVRVFWGAVPHDSGNPLNPRSRAEPKADAGFSLNGADAQVWMRDFCRKTAAWNNGRNAECFMADFERWLNQTASDDGRRSVLELKCGGATRLPVPEGSFTGCLREWNREENRIWRSGWGFGEDVPFAYATFDTGLAWDASFNDQGDSWERWERWTAEQLAGAPDALKGGYQTSGGFHFWDTNKQLQRAAYSAAIIAIVISSIICLLGTRDPVVSLYATVCIFSVLSCVGATVHGLGWTLGFLESICFSVLIGLSVDFVIHFAHAFSHAPPAEAKDGDGRARHSLRTMSKAILSAGFTTAAASVMLMVCEIVFYTKFGLVLLVTMAYSLVASFVFFHAMTFGTIGALGSGKKEVTTYAEGAGEIEIT